MLIAISCVPDGSRLLCPVSSSQTEFDLPLLKRSMLELWTGVKAARYFPCTRSSSRLNVGHVSIYNNGKFAPASYLRHPRRDVTYIAFHCVLMGKVYWGMGLFLKVGLFQEVRVHRTTYTLHNCKLFSTHCCSYCCKGYIFTL